MTHHGPNPAKYTSPLILPDDDGIVVVMSDVEPKTVTREEFNRELVQAVDDLVASARHHGELIKASFENGEEVSRRADAWRAQVATARSVVRETPPPYGEVPERLDRIERTLTEIRDQMEGMRRTMATKIELEAMNDRIKMVADGYQTVNNRLDSVANLLKLRVVLP